MQLVVIHNNRNKSSQGSDGMLGFAVTNRLVAGFVFNGLSTGLPSIDKGPVIFSLPQDWCTEFSISSPQIVPRSNDIALSDEHVRLIKHCSWLIISNGRFMARANGKLLKKILAQTQADVLTVNASCDLLACAEKVRLTPQGKLAGFRRLYSDYAEPAAVPSDWPHHIFVRNSVVDSFLENAALPQSFSVFLRTVRSNALKMQSINMAGTSLDLSTEQGLLSFLADTFGSTSKKQTNFKIDSKDSYNNGPMISPNARVMGKVLFGHNVTVGQNAIIIGPAIIGDRVRIEDGSVIMSSVVAPGITVPRNKIIRNRALISNGEKREKQLVSDETSRATPDMCGRVVHRNVFPDNFRTWPKFSYAACFKRVADIVMAIVVLLLFVPVMPIIALVVKLSSNGPVFFKDKRQGLYGRAFNCLKFRTMLVGADRIQDKLRTLNFADGPQFKMADDPRISVIGRFLRDTYIDEIPQFFNVLLGQMSVVGPRPSPESENTLCPHWRDARLSVRPGITGLWQVCSTRQPMKDFQEWIYYDTKYVRDLSLGMDLWICWQTIRKVFRNFVRQF